MKTKALSVMNKTQFHWKDKENPVLLLREKSRLKSEDGNRDTKYTANYYIGFFSQTDYIISRNQSRASRQCLRSYEAKKKTKYKKKDVDIGKMDTTRHLTYYLPILANWTRPFVN